MPGGEFGGLAQYVTVVRLSINAEVESPQIGCLIIVVEPAVFKKLVEKSWIEEK